MSKVAEEWSLLAQDGMTRIDPNHYYDRDAVKYYSDFYQNELYSSKIFDPVVDRDFYNMKLSDYPVTPYVGLPNPPNRFIPCTENLRPLYKWNRGCYLYDDAAAFLNCKVIAENMKGCQFIALDIDGDHDLYDLDLQTIEFGMEYKDKTSCWYKPGLCMEYDPDLWNREIGFCSRSFHLIFETDRIIPTMHFPHCHIDILGNKNNQLRYLKNKKWNGMEPIKLTHDIWEDIKGYIRDRQLFGEERKGECYAEEYYQGSSHGEDEQQAADCSVV